MSDYQAIVVGSGAGGLSSALSLSRNGFSVLLLEAMPSFGGYLNPFSRKRYKFDTGLHYLGQLGKGEQFWKLLDTLGIADRVRFIELDPEGFDRYIFGDYEFRLGKGRERFKEDLLRAFPGEERGITRFLKIHDRIAEAVQASMSIKGGFPAMVKFLLRHPVMLRYSRAPYQALLDQVTTDKRLQAVLAGNSATYGLPPERASSVSAVMVLDHYLKGAYYPEGGSGAFRDAFLDALQDLGAEMKNTARVVRIDKKGDEFLVDTASGETYTARVVISNADPTLTLGKLINPGIVPLKIRKKVQRLRPSVGALYAFIGTDLDLPSLGITNGNIYHHENFDVNGLYRVMTASSPPETMPFYFVSSPSVKDPQGGHAPPDRHTVEILTWIDHRIFEKWENLPSMKRGEEYEALKKKVGARLVKAGERYIPGLSGHLDHVEYATPLSNTYWVSAVKGGSYGPEHTPDQVGQGRFITFSAGIEGLFLAGAGTLGGGVMACVASGVLAGEKAAGVLRSKS